MSDLISRQAAIESLYKEIIKRRLLDDVNDGMLDEFDTEDILRKLPSVEPEYDLDGYSSRLWKAAYERGKQDAEPETQWIPCSERLPEEDGQYLITVKYEHVDGYEDIYSEHGEWYDGKWDMSLLGHCGKVERITAWKPMPEPYREDKK